MHQKGSVTAWAREVLRWPSPTSVSLSVIINLLPLNFMFFSPFFTLSTNSVLISSLAILLSCFGEKVWFKFWLFLHPNMIGEFYFHAKPLAFDFCWYGIWLYQFLIIAYLFTLTKLPCGLPLADNRVSVLFICPSLITCDILISFIPVSWQMRQIKSLSYIRLTPVSSLTFSGMPQKMRLKSLFTISSRSFSFFSSIF